MAHNPVNRSTFHKMSVSESAFSSLRLFFGKGHPDSTNIAPTLSVNNSTLKSQAQVLSNLELPRHISWDTKGHFTRLLPKLFPCIRPYLLLFLIAIVASASWAETKALSDEFKIKSTFIYNFAQLVSWPADAISNVDQQLLLCTYGEDPFQGKLESTVEGKQVGSLTFHIRHLNQVTSELRVCNILFVSKDESKHFASLLSELHNMPVLTIGESDTFLRDGGVICFTMRNGKIRFAINLEAADRCRLKISSRLLLLAEKVIGNSSGRQ
jgi:hypothetical protein